MTPEGRVVAYLCKRCTELGWEARKVEWSGRRGAPDWFIMAPSNGISFWVEAKAPGQKPRPHQVREIERMRKAGNEVFVVASVEEVDLLISHVKDARYLASVALKVFGG